MSAIPLLHPALAWVTIAGLALLAISAAASDVTSRRIPNVLCIAIAVLAPFWWYARDGFEGLAGQLAAATLVAMGASVLFALRKLGGGDVKLVGALALWIRPEAMPAMIFATAMAGGAIGLAILVRRRQRPCHPPRGVPYGVAIVLGSLTALARSTGQA